MVILFQYPKKVRLFIFANLGAVKTDSFAAPLKMNLQMLNQLKLAVLARDFFTLHIDDYSYYMTKKQEVKVLGFRVLSAGEEITYSLI